MEHEFEGRTPKEVRLEDRLLSMAQEISYPNNAISNELELRAISQSYFEEVRTIEKRDNVLGKMVSRYVDSHEDLVTLSIFQHDVARMHLLPRDSVIGEYLHLIPNGQREVIAKFRDTAVSELQDTIRVIDRGLHNYRLMMLYLGKEFLNRDVYDVTYMVRDEMLRRNSDEQIEIAEGIQMSRVTSWDDSSFRPRRETNYFVTIGLESDDQNLTNGFEIPIGYKSLLKDGATPEEDSSFTSRIYERLRKEFDISAAFAVGFFGSFHLGFACGELKINGWEIMNRADQRDISVKDFIAMVADVIREEVTKYRS